MVRESGVDLMPEARGERGFIYQKIGSRKGLSNAQVQHVEPLSDGRMLIVTWRSINIYDGAKMTVFPRNNEYDIPHYRFRHKIMVDEKERVWVKEWGKLWCLNLRTGKSESDMGALLPENLQSKFDTDQIIDIFYEKGNRFWFLTSDGLWDSKDGNKVPLPIEIEKLADIRSAEEKLLIFDIDGGITVIDNTGNSPATSQTLLVEGSYIPSDKEIWDLQVIEGDDNRFYRLMSFSGYSRVDELNLDSMKGSPIVESEMLLHGLSLPVEGHLFIGSRHGILEIAEDSTFLNIAIPYATMHPGLEQVYKPSRFYSGFRTIDETVLKDVVVINMCMDRQGGVWLSLGDLGVLYSHPLRFRIHSSPDYQSLGIPDSAAARSHKRLSVLYNTMAQRENDSLTDLHGNQWIATHNGVLLINKDDTLRITQSDGLSCNYVQSIAEDHNGKIWIATTHGLNCIESISPLSITNYGLYDGMPEWDINTRSATVLDDGRIIIKCVQGWIAFDPDNIKKPSFPLSPLLTDLYVNDRRINEGLNDEGVILDCEPPYVDDITLDYYHNNITLFFNSANYAFPESIEYRWRIVGDAGKDIPWVSGTKNTDENGQLRLSFIQLLPGKYKIEVMASTDNNFTESSVTSFMVRITPPWWQTWWAYSSYVILFLVVIAVGVKLYLNYQKRMLEQRRREEILLLRIHHLMEQTRLQKEIQTEREVATIEESGIKEEQDEQRDEDELQPIDSEFIQKAITLVEQHLHEAYTVEELAADLCMERTGLYKKLTSLINTSPQLFIRSIRLNRAATLLKEGVSVTDTAYQTGFSSVSYFSRTFAKEFGCTPSEYCKQKS